ncbi:MAG: diguanylate cyclase [Aliarcobacter sp.]|nr:diguanylate cyclase [Aliarcobacter sp.]
MTQKNFHKFFTLYFIIFGIVISLVGAITSYTFQVNDIQKELDRKAKEISEIKINTILKPSIENMNNIVKSLGNNKIIRDFIRTNNFHKKEELEQIFFAIASSNNILMQARLIDKNGQEIIRVDRDNKTKNVFLVDEKDCQNKANRDYFKTLSSSKNEDIWYSKIDLNIEDGKIEIPYKPTLRVALPLIQDNQFAGTVIVNILVNNLFDSIGTSSSFDHYIIDKEQNYILHKNRELSFNKYKNIKIDIKNDFPDGLNTTGVYAYPLKDILNNDDDAVMILKTKKDYKKDLMIEKINTAVFVFAITVILSLIMAFLASKTPSRLQEKLLRAHEKLNEFTLIIDRYVITATTKPDSTITHISSAFEKSSGYTKEELIGKPMAIIKDEKRDKKIIQELWETILNKKIWMGEIKNRNKDGKEYWLEQHIIPKVNIETNEIENFVSIGIDITSKKEIEKIASTDKLTGIYNRRMLDEFLQIEIDVAQRHESELSLIIVDIDHFKDVNDKYGHLIGDETLKTMSSIISENTRNSDIFGRYGGEEFLIICSHTNKENTFILAEKLRKIVENYNFDKVGTKTISLGISSYEKNDNLELLFKKADDALYCAKEEGRNRTIIYKEKV